MSTEYAYQTVIQLKELNASLKGFLDKILLLLDKLITSLPKTPDYTAAIKESVCQMKEEVEKEVIRAFKKVFL